jgi:hypothetical protein
MYPLPENAPISQYDRIVKAEAEQRVRKKEEFWKDLKKRRNEYLEQRKKKEEKKNLLGNAKQRT